jgi:hypothetical protein
MSKLWWLGGSIEYKSVRRIIPRHQYLLISLTSNFSSRASEATQRKNEGKVLPVWLIGKTAFSSVTRNAVQIFCTFQFEGMR